MENDPTYHDGMRQLQDLRDTRRIADRLEQVTLHTNFSDDDRTVLPQEEQKSYERSDEFLRNFFIKFGMSATLESFQQEWFELKAKGKVDAKSLPQIPEIYRKNAELSDELATLQEELDEARVIAEKARSTYDKLKKQMEFQKINHRRVQQEK